MSLLEFFAWINQDLLALPGTIIFAGGAIILSIKTGFIQLRGFPTLVRLLAKLASEEHCEKKKAAAQKRHTISPMQAVFSALAQTIGMGSIVGPTVAIMKGGPGALFWLLLYFFFASATKFAEVTFAMQTREKTPCGYVIGGPMQYLKLLSPTIAFWYSCVIAVLYMGFSSLQSNALANILAMESVPHWLVGLTLAGLALITLLGGVKRIGQVTSKLVPVMFILYVSFGIYVLIENPLALRNALTLIKDNTFSTAAMMGGFWGATVFCAIRYGVFRGIYVSESGLGTSAIPHAVSDAKTPVNQGLLAMGTFISDLILSTVSGLLVLVTGVWARGEVRATLIYEIFKNYAPFVGQLVLLATFSLFVLTTIIGNGFTGSQSFASLTQRRWLKWYIACMAFVIFAGTLMPFPLVWEILDTLMFAAAVPNIIGVVYLAFKYPQVLKLKNASV